nr:MAG: ORF1 [Torque teno virus]
MWWWRRRRWRVPWRRRRWRRRRPRTRRFRRAARRPRRPRVRRPRRRRGWARRYRLRRRRRRRRRRKLILTQWQPAKIRKCLVIGYLALVLCGNGTFSRNYASHSDDYIQKGPFGGGLSSMRFNMRILYDQFKRHLNFWTHTNQDLDLVRYRGCTITLYRHPEVDFIVKFNRKPPFLDTVVSAPAMHPGMLMTTKHKILVKSFKTKPKGKGTVKVRIRPPTLFDDRWYFQHDICKTTLFTISATPCDLRFPFCPPQTDNPCVNFLVLAGVYNGKLSIEATKVESEYNALTSAINMTTQGTLFNTFKTPEMIKCPAAVKKTESSDAGTNCYKKLDSNWGDVIWNDQTIENFKSNTNNLWAARGNQTMTGSKYLNYRTGIYSAIFLSAGRLSPDFGGLYNDIVYNPTTDEGIGNIVWIDWCTKADCNFNETQAKGVLKDIPLWAALFGYVDFLKKTFKDDQLDKTARLTLICPYTKPQLVGPTQPNKGFVPYDYNFGRAHMPSGESYIPIYYRFRWYICLFHQQKFIEDIVSSGPFAYHGSQASATLTTKYKFHFLFGGNPVPQQTVRDPCNQPVFDIPGAGGLPRPIQVVDPKYVNEGYTFHAWDFRRGLFGQAAIKRVSGEQTNASLYSSGPKRPRTEIPPQDAEEGSYSREGKLQPWLDSSEQEESETEAPEEEATSPPSLQLQLKQQIREQRQLRCGIQHLFQQLMKTQQNLHINPCLQ